MTEETLIKQLSLPVKNLIILKEGYQTKRS